MEQAVHQINVKVNKTDLDFIDAKARRYGISRSSLLKVMALNAELVATVDPTKSLRLPKT